MDNEINEMIKQIATMRKTLAPHQRGLDEHLYDAERALQLSLKDIKREKELAADEATYQASRARVLRTR